MTNPLQTAVEALENVRAMRAKDWQKFYGVDPDEPLIMRSEALAALRQVGEAERIEGQDWYINRNDLTPVKFAKKVDEFYRNTPQPTQVAPRTVSGDGMELPPLTMTSVNDRWDKDNRNHPGAFEFVAYRQGWYAALAELNWDRLPVPQTTVPSVEESLGPTEVYEVVLAAKEDMDKNTVRGDITFLGYGLLPEDLDCLRAIRDRCGYLPAGSIQRLHRHDFIFSIMSDWPVGSDWKITKAGKEYLKMMEVSYKVPQQGDPT